MAKRSKKKKRPPETGQAQVTDAKKILPRQWSGVPWPAIVQALVIAAAVLWIYWPTLRGDWLWDDDLYIRDNPLLHEPGRLWKAWFEPGSWVEYYPIEETVQWVQWRLWGTDTLGYHLTNVALHILGALLVWRLLGKFGLRLAWLGGLIFALHPVQVESVAWISELKNTLSLPPFLLAMCAWINYEEHRKSKDYFLALGLFLAAMLCKITMAPFPVVILLYAWWKRGRIRWGDVKVTAPFWLISLALGFTAISTGQTYLEHNHAGPDALHLGGIFSRLACGGLSLSFYFSKCFLPVELMPIYPQWTVDPPALYQFLPWLVLGGAIYWLWTKRRTWGRHALLGLGFFLIFLTPFLGFMAISYMAFTWVMDHFLYLPIIGLIGVAVAALGQIERRFSASFRPYSIGLGAVVLVFLAFDSRGYAKMFVNEETLWTYELQHNPEAYVAYNNLGHLLRRAGRLTEAIEQFEQALRIKPDFAETHTNLGRALQQTGRLSEAFRQFEQALQLSPDYAEAHFDFATALLQSGQAPEAIEQYRQALKINPDDADTRTDLGFALLQTGQTYEAMEQFEQVLQIRPGDFLARTNLGGIFFQAGRFPEAIEQFEQAALIKPDNADAHYNLGNALVQAGRVPEAIEQYGQALQLKPDFAAARHNLEQAQALQEAAPAKN